MRPILFLVLYFSLACQQEVWFTPSNPTDSVQTKKDEGVSWDPYLLDLGIDESFSPPEILLPESPQDLLKDDIFSHLNLNPYVKSGYLYQVIHHKRVSGPVDMVIILDESPSMQHRFVAIKKSLDYLLRSLEGESVRILVTSSEVKGAALPGSVGAPFLLEGNNNFYLDLQDPPENLMEVFQSTQIPPCEASRYKYNEQGLICGSEDTHPLQALNRLIHRPEVRREFFRPQAPLFVLIFSDGDERMLFGGQGLKPLEIISNIQELSGERKPIFTYAWSVRPGDQACLNQSAVHGEAWPGNTLQEWVRLNRGRQLSICLSDYTLSMGHVIHKVKNLGWPSEHQLKTGYVPIRKILTNKGLLTDWRQDGDRLYLTKKIHQPEEFLVIFDEGPDVEDETL